MLTVLGKKVILRNIASFFVIGLLFLGIFDFPNFAASNTHDFGSQAAYGYWTLHGYLYGKDIVQNVGPLGFLGYPFIYTGFLDLQKLLIHAFLTGSFVFLLWKTSNSMSFKARIVFLVFAGVFSTVRADDMFYLLLLLLGYQLILNPRLRTILFSTTLLSILALEKGTFLFISIFIILSSFIVLILSRRNFSAVLTVGSFTMFFLAIWVMVGQPINNLPVFIYRMAWFSIGYNEAMTFFEPIKIQVLGFTAFFCSLFIILLSLLQTIRKLYLDIPKMSQQIFLSAIDSFILFAVWKHGFVRADGGHVVIFFGYVLVSNIWILCRENDLSKRLELVDRSIWLSKSFATLVVIGASILAINATPSDSYKNWSSHWTTPYRFVELFNLKKFFAKLNTELKTNISDTKSPIVNDLVGKESVGYFGMLPAVMLYNGLNYKPTPSTISFASWNDLIMKADELFFKDDNHAPDYILFNLETVDNRLVAQDDSLAQLEILHRYSVVGFEKENIILRHIKRVMPFSIKAISQRTYNIGSLMDVPASSVDPIWVTMKVNESFLSKIVSFFYKPPRYLIEFFGKNGFQDTFKFMPRMARSGFLINPLIIDNSSAVIVLDRLKYLHKRESVYPGISKIVKVRVICDKMKYLCGKKIDVSYENIIGLSPSHQKNLKISYGSIFPFEHNFQNKYSYRNGVFGRLDTLNYHNGILDISGWAATKAPPVPVDSVELKINGKYYPAMYSLARPDIANYFHQKNYMYSGFVSHINVKPPKGGTCHVSIVAVDNKMKELYEGKKHDILCGIPPDVDLSNKKLYVNGYFGHIDSLQFHDGILDISGWAAMRNPLSSVAMIVIKINESYYFASSNLMRSDVATHFHQPRYMYSGYTGSVKIQPVKGGNCSVSIIIVNSHRNRFYQSREHSVSCGVE